MRRLREVSANLSQVRRLGGADDGQEDVCSCRWESIHEFMGAVHFD
jgi:hypothetical protein